jgi:pimeloyl-ACP methyl ester carboxylesterase
MRLTQAADALVAVMSAAGAPVAHQLGFSFGGMVAQCFARRHPARTVSSIAYACVPIMLTKITSPRLVNARIQREFARTPWLTFCETFSRQVIARADLQQALGRKAALHPPAVRDAINEAMIFGMSLDPNFRYAMPVAQIRGGRDDRFPGAAPAMDALTATLPAELVEDIPGGGHLAHIEQPEAFLAALARLLSRLDARRV